MSSAHNQPTDIYNWQRTHGKVRGFSCFRSCSYQPPSSPKHTLQSYRRVDPGAKYSPCFGMNLIHADTGYILNVGDVLEIVETTSLHHKKIGVWQPRGLELA